MTREDWKSADEMKQDIKQGDGPDDPVEVEDVDWDAVDPSEPPKQTCRRCGETTEYPVRAPAPLEAAFCPGCAKTLAGEMHSRASVYAVEERLDRLDELEDSPTPPGDDS